MAKKETRFTRVKRISDQRAECSAEIILPDYNPDVRKILHVSADPHPVSVFAAGDGVECSGGVNFDVVYLDFEGAVCSASFSGDYDFKVKCNTENYKDSLMETELCGVSLRLMSPRKIVAKATLDNSVTILSDEEILVEGDLLDESQAPELDTITTSASYVAFSQPVEREYAESIYRFDGKTVDEVHVIHTTVAPSSMHIDAVDDGAEISGKLDVSMLVKTDDMPLYRIEKIIDVAEKISMPDIKSEGDLNVVLDVASVTTNVNGDEAGVELVLNVVTEARLVCEGNETLEIIGDAYLCNAECNNSYADISLDHYLGKVNHKGEINESVSLADFDIGKIREVVYADAALHIEDCYMDNQTIAVVGKIQVSSIASEIKDDGDVEYVPLKFTTEFKQNVKHNCQNTDKIRALPHIKLLGVSVTVDSNAAYLKADADSSFTLSEEKSVRVLNSSNVCHGSRIEKNPSQIVVYYPTSDDTLYSVAKSYHTTRERLISDNPAIVETSSEGGKISNKVRRLIIT